MFVALRRQNDVDVSLIVPSTWRSEYTGETIRPTLLPAVDFPVHRLPVVRPGHVSLHAYRWLPRGGRRAGDFAPDLVYAAQEPWSLSAWQAMRLARALRVPFVFHTNQNIVKRFPPPFAWIERASYRQAALALAYSEEARQVMQRKGRTRLSAVVPYGTDLRRFFPDPAAAARQRALLGLGAGDFVIGYLGRLIPAKGLDLLVDACARLQNRPKLPNLRVLLVGSGPDEARLHEQAGAAGLGERIVFAGAIAHDRAAEFLRCLDLFVLPSRTTPAWKEQFGRVLIEALACGVPVIGSSSGEIPHLIARTGGGVTFHEGDAADLAEKIAFLMNRGDERARLADRGGQAVRAHYTHEAVARQMVELFAQVLRGGGGDPAEKNIL